VTNKECCRRIKRTHIAEYGVTAGGVHALAGDAPIIRLWRRIRRLRRSEPDAARWLAIEQHLLQCYGTAESPVMSE